MRVCFPQYLSSSCRSFPFRQCNTSKLGIQWYYLFPLWYDGSQYKASGLPKTQRSFVQIPSMVWWTDSRSMRSYLYDLVYRPFKLADSQSMPRTPTTQGDFKIHQFANHSYSQFHYDRLLRIIEELLKAYWNLRLRSSLVDTDLRVQRFQHWTEVMLERSKWAFPVAATAIKLH